jgi:steroid delta-isomerase-like uncharacterized protein
VYRSWASTGSFAPAGAGRQSILGVAVNLEGTTGGGAGTPAGWMQRYLDAGNARDVDGVVGFMSEDVVLADLPLGEQVHGKAAAREFVARVMSAYSSDFRRQLGRLVVDDGTTYAFEFSETGTNDLAVPGSRFPATGRRFELSVVSIGRVRAGEIVEHKDYWDLTDYLRQVGLMPSAATEG